MGERRGRGIILFCIILPLLIQPGICEIGITKAPFEVLPDAVEDQGALTAYITPIYHYSPFEAHYIWGYRGGVTGDRLYIAMEPVPAKTEPPFFAPNHPEMKGYLGIIYSETLDRDSYIIFIESMKIAEIYGNGLYKIRVYNKNFNFMAACFVNIDNTPRPEIISRDTTSPPGTLERSIPFILTQGETFLLTYKLPDDIYDAIEIKQQIPDAIRLLGFVNAIPSQISPSEFLFRRPGDKIKTQIIVNASVTQWGVIELPPAQFRYRTNTTKRDIDTIEYLESTGNTTVWVLPFSPNLPDILERYFTGDLSKDYCIYTLRHFRFVK